MHSNGSNVFLPFPSFYYLIIWYKKNMREKDGTGKNFLFYTIPN